MSNNQQRYLKNAQQLDLYKQVPSYIKKILEILKMKDECYEFLKNQIGKANIVGFGSYGQVKIARNTQSNQIVAIKLIHGKNAKQQIDVHHKLNHPNIIKLLNYYYEKDRNITYMVLQYAENGSLNQKIKFGLGQLSKQLIKKYFKNICQAIKYLHKNNYMHRDIKPENILITKQNVAKLCDFGFAAIFQARTTMCGTFQYMAPEMIKKKHYNYKIDIWALGILLFEMIQGLAPFRGQTGQQVLAEMKRPIKFSQRFDPLQIDLIKKILRVNAENRPTAEQILQHPYFKQIKEDQITGRPSVFPQNNNICQVQPRLEKSQILTSNKQKLNSSKQQLSQFFKYQQNRSNPMQTSQIQKPRSPMLQHYLVQKKQSIIPNFIQNNQLNKSFKDKEPIATKNQRSQPINEKQPRKTLNTFGLHSPQNQKKNFSPLNYRTQFKQEKLQDFPIKTQQKNTISSNFGDRNSTTPQNSRIVNKKTNEVSEFDLNDKKKSITGQTAGTSYRFLNKSFKDLKTVETNQQQKQQINLKNYQKPQLHSQGMIINGANVRKNVNMSISAVSTSFNNTNTRANGQYQSPNSSFNIYPQSYQQNTGIKQHGSGQLHFSPVQMVNFQKPTVGNVGSHKQLI